MTANTTSVPGNATAAHPAPGSPAGLAVGLTIFFLLLVIVAGVLMYKYHSTIRSMLQSGQRGSIKKEDYTDAPQDDSQHYTSMIREQSTGQTPIYENLTTRARDNRCAVNQRGSPSEPEEDLYLQCDSPDDAIYSNDPACNLSILPDSREEDVYLMPDS